MVSIGNSVKDFKTMCFETERIEAQKIVPGDMVLFENDFLEVKITGHRIVDREAGKDIWTLPDDNKRTVHIDLLFEPGLEYQPGRRLRQSEHKMGDKVVRLRDSTADPQMAMKTHEDAEAIEREYNLVLDNLNAYFAAKQEGIKEMEDSAESALIKFVMDREDKRHG